MPPWVFRHLQTYHPLKGINDLEIREAAPFGARYGGPLEVMSVQLSVEQCRMNEPPGKKRKIKKQPRQQSPPTLRLNKRTRHRRKPKFGRQGHVPRLSSCIG